MRTAAEYRAEAENYVRLAETLPQGARRVRLLDMAQSCIRLADQAALLESQPGTNGREQPVFAHFDFPTLKDGA
jgi:hypothetical protein